MMSCTVGVSRGGASRTGHRLMPKNANQKRRIRAYAAEHNISYQRAYHALNTSPEQSPPDGDGYELGRRITITSDGLADTYRADIPFVWNPFANNQSPTILMDQFAHSTWSSITHVLATHRQWPATRVLAITGPICESWPLAETEETRWLADESSGVEFTQFQLGNEGIGYHRVRDAAAAIDAFRPPAGSIGVVLLSLSHPYPQVTEESNATEFEQYWRGTTSEALWKPSPLTDGPYWCSTPDDQSMATDENSVIRHILSAAERSAYTDYLNAIRRLLREARSRRIVVFVCSDDNDDVIGDVVDIFGEEEFGVRISTKLHLEYEQPPTLDGPRDHADRLARFMNLPQLLSRTDLVTGYWWGANPKQHRTVLAQFPDWPEAQMLLLKDPPEVPSYWSPTYESMCTPQRVTE